MLAIIMFVGTVVVLHALLNGKKNSGPTLRVGDPRMEMAEVTCPACLGGSGTLGLCDMHRRKVGQFKSRNERDWYTKTERLEKLDAMVHTKKAVLANGLSEAAVAKIDEEIERLEADLARLNSEAV